MAFAAIPAVLAVAGAGISAVGTIEQGQAASNAASYQATVAQNNAIIANQNADYAVKAGEATAAATSMKGAATSAAIKTSQAANGIDVNSGSAAVVQASQREKNVLDTETVMNNAELQAYGYRAAATGYTANAGLDTLQATQAPIGADIAAGGNLLSAASSIGTKWGSPAQTTGAPLDISPSATNALG